MITLHRLNGEPFTLNNIHIEIIEARPDTLITLTNERKYLVTESVDEILSMIKSYNQSVFEAARTLSVK